MSRSCKEVAPSQRCQNILLQRRGSPFSKVSEDSCREEQGFSLKLDRVAQNHPESTLMWSELCQKTTKNEDNPLMWLVHFIYVASFRSSGAVDSLPEKLSVFFGIGLKAQELSNSKNIEIF